MKPENLRTLKQFVEEVPAFRSENGRPTGKIIALMRRNPEARWIKRAGGRIYNALRSRCGARTAGSQRRPQ